MVKKVVKSKNSKKDATQQRLKPIYQTNYLIAGLIILFISLLTFFDGGFIGVLFANTARLIIGESYSLIVFSIALWGSYLIIKGQLPKIPWYKYVGAFLIIMAITTVLHFNAFNGIEPNRIFQRTYEIFQNDLVTNQNRANLGGGLLGAVFYSVFGYLFGRWGTYLFSTILFVIGFCVIESINIKMLHLFIKVTIKKLSLLLNKLFPNINEMKEVFNRDTEEELFEEEKVGAIEEVSVNQHIKNRSLFSKFFKKNNIITNAEDQEYMPSFQPKDSKEFPIFKAEENPIINRIVREEKILDLDYFDQYNQKRHVVIDDVTEENSKVVIHSIVDDQETEAVREKLVEQEESKEILLSSTQSADETDLPLFSAGHWQSQAGHKQDLTSDVIDEVLSQIEEEPVQSILKKNIKKNKTYQLPGKNLLKKIPPVDQSEEYARISENIKKLERTFDSFGVNAKVVQANLGPSVTKYEIEPAIGVKVSKIVSLSDDIALALAARDIRMEAPIPGKSLIGIEVPNTQISPVSFWEIIDAALESKNLLEVPLGRDISGSVCLADLSKMPHLLIAGATGSGKSVGMNVIIVSLLMKAHPDDVKFLMIDPKKVELTMYDDLPHQLVPVVTNPRKAAQALNKVVQEMERRYELFAASGVRNIDSYNEQVDDWNQESLDTVYEKLPKIIVFVDELADLMMVASNEVENAIIRLAQMARAAGIHMIIATQRPSVDVITGIIKANVPSRLAFAVSSGTDSRTILDSVGAEKLLGRGDMLFQPMGKNKPVRVQGAYISDNEVEKITDFIKEQQLADYQDSLINLEDESDSVGTISEDEYFDEAIEMLQGLETISISQLQRKFRIGYNRAARLIDDMEKAGFVSAQDGSKPRQVL